MSLLTAFERELVSRIIAGHPGREVYARQLASAEVADRDYTGVGLFVMFRIQDRSERFPTSRRDIGTLYLVHPELEHGAFAVLFKDAEGVLEMLELVTVDGEWPQDESRFTVDSVPASEPADSPDRPGP